MTALRRAVPAAYLGLVFAFIFLPVVVLIVFSFQDGRLPVPPFRGPTLRWYGTLLGNARLIASLGNSILVAGGSAFLSTLLGLLAAYGLSQQRGRMAAVAQFLLLAPLFVAYLVIGMGLLIGFGAAGLPRGLAAVTAGHVVINLPVAFALLHSQTGRDLAALERAARDLGAPEWRVLVRVTAPTLAPAMLAAFLLTFTLSWDEFLIAFLLSVFEVTLPVELWTMLRRGLSPEANAAGTIVFVASAGVLALALLAGTRRRRR